MSYVNISNLVITDSSNNMVRADVRQSMLRLDVQPPTVTGFSLDMDTGSLLIEFSEAIRSFKIASYYLQSNETYPEIVQRFTGSIREELSPTCTSINVTLLDGDSQDLDMIKLYEYLATNENNTFLRWDADGAVDFSSLELDTLNATNMEAIRVRNLTEDTTDPELISFTLDMDGMPELSLTFDEPVHTDTINFAAISLLSRANTSGLTSEDFYTLSSGAIITENGRLVTFKLDFIDMVEIQVRRSLAVSEATSFVALQPSAIFDMNVNPSLEVSIRSS